MSVYHQLLHLVILQLLMEVIQFVKYHIHLKLLVRVGLELLFVFIC